MSDSTDAAIPWQPKITITTDGTGPIYQKDGIASNPKKVPNLNGDIFKLKDWNVILEKVPTLEQRMEKLEKQNELLKEMLKYIINKLDEKEDN